MIFCQGGELLVARSKQTHPKSRAVPQERGDISCRLISARHQPAAQEQLHSYRTRRLQPSSLLGLPRQDRRVKTTFCLFSFRLI